MKSPVILISAVVVSASIFDTILPTTLPSETTDPWECTTKTIEAFFDVPMPTGKLFDAVLSFGDDLQKGCKSTLSDYLGMPVCEYPPHTKWCSFEQAAPATLISEYSSYAKTASSWWARHSSAAVDEAELCPNRWFEAMMYFPGGPSWLNGTIAFAGCYAAAHATDEPLITGLGTTTSRTTSTGVVPTASAPKSTTSSPSESNAAPARAFRNADSAGRWILLAGLVAAAANAML